MRSRDGVKEMERVGGRAAVRSVPLAERMRPRTLEEFVGQERLIGPGAFLRSAILEDRVPSMVLWGPPGSGKTTLARIIAHATRAEFVQLSATGSGLKELREIITRAQELQRLGGAEANARGKGFARPSGAGARGVTEGGASPCDKRRTVFFIDEIHRWNKAQQDALLPHVESGTLTLIGATTENPSFEVNGALMSRARVFVLERLGADALATLLRRAWTDAERGIGRMVDIAMEEVITFIAQMANGDARMALNTLEAVAGQRGAVTIALVKEVLQKSHLLYDKSGEEHYNVISALHKSMRGGDANAAVYWLARMLEGGEDPLYVARRVVRFASEDIGLANNTALLVASAAFDACHKIGMPECGVHLAQAVIYCAKSAKSIIAYEAYERAKRDVEDFGNLPVPLHLRNAPTRIMKDLAYGKGYKYTPNEDSSAQTYLPPELEGRKYVE